MSMKKSVFISIMWFAIFNVAATSITLQPVSSGFIKQQGNTSVWTQQNAEVKTMANYCREMVLDFSLEDLDFTPQSALLRIFCSSVDQEGGFIINAFGIEQSVFELPYQTVKELPSHAGIAIDKNTESLVNQWIEIDVSEFIGMLDLTATTQIAFRVEIVSVGNTALMKFNTHKATINRPELLLSETPPEDIRELAYCGIKSIVASNSSERGAVEYAFNGAGLLPGMVHTNKAYDNAWITDLPKESELNSGLHWINVELNRPVNLSKMHIWNLSWLYGANQDDFSNRGVKDMEIYVSNSDEDLSNVAYSDERWAKQSDVQLTRNEGSPDQYSYQEIDFEVEPKGVRWIGFHILSNYSDDHYTGIGEIKLFERVEVSGDISTDGQIPLSDKINIYAINHKLYCNRLEINLPVIVYSVLGGVVCRTNADDLSSGIILPPGIYVLRIGDHTQKVCN